MDGHNLTDADFLRMVRDQHVAYGGFLCHIARDLGGKRAEQRMQDFITADFPGADVLSYSGTFTSLEMIITQDAVCTMPLACKLRDLIAVGGMRLDDLLARVTVTQTGGDNG